MDNQRDTVLRCEQCNKPFDKEASLKRHRYYCRTRKNGPTLTPRTRACKSCVKRKARCDNKRPICTTCAKKGIVCSYPESTTRADGDREGQPSNDQQNDTSTFPASQLDSLTKQEIVQQPVSTVGDLVQYGTSGLGSPILDWNELDMTLTSFLNDYTIDQSLSFGSVQPTTQPSSSFQMFPQSSSMPSFSIPTVPNCNARSIIARARPDPPSQRTVQLIMHTLKSHLRMMRNNNSPPPFVHHALVADRTEPMETCFTLMSMRNGDVRGSRKVFWRNVNRECERFFNESANFTGLELLAALQALSIYIFVRLDEGQTEYNDFDTLMLATVTTMALQMATNQQLLDRLAEESDDAEAMWQRWVIEESFNRLCVIYRTIDMLAYFDPAAMCDLPSYLLLAPLPARKQLWEAPDAKTWYLESSKNPSGEPMYGLTANGDLVKWTRHDQKFPCKRAWTMADELSIADSAQNWQEWCSGMDGMGPLIMLLASLVG